MNKTSCKSNVSSQATFYMLSGTRSRRLNHIQTEATNTRQTSTADKCDEEVPAACSLQPGLRSYPVSRPRRGPSVDEVAPAAFMSSFRSSP